MGYHYHISDIRLILSVYSVRCYGNKERLPLNIVEGPHLLFLFRTKTKKLQSKSRSAVRVALSRVKNLLPQAPSKTTRTSFFDLVAGLGAF